MHRPEAASEQIVIRVPASLVKALSSYAAKQKQKPAAAARYLLLWALEQAGEDV
jgi:hypothetical protein